MDESFTAAELLQAASQARLDEGTLGKLTGMLADWRLGGSRKQTLKLLQASGLQDLLASSEFMDGLGAGRFKSKSLLKHAFKRYPSSPGSAIGLIGKLLDAGCLNLFSSSSLGELHRGMSTWNSPIPKTALLITIASSFDTFGKAGMFIGLLLEHGESSFAGPDEVEEVLEGVLGNADVRDLAGEPEDMARALPDYADLVRHALREDGSGSDSGSDAADEDGNLAGFVEDDIRYDTDVSGEEKEEDGEEDSDETDRDDGSEGKATASRKRRREHASATDGSTSDDGVLPQSNTRTGGAKRMRKLGAPAPAPAPASRGKGKLKAKAPSPASRSRYIDGAAGGGHSSSSDSE